MAPLLDGGSPEPSDDPQDDGESEFLPETSGSYLLTAANTEAMIRSLRKNIKDVTIMREADIAKLERWHDFCLRNGRFCVLYQIDF